METLTIPMTPLSEAQAEEIYAQGKEAVIFVLLQLSAELAKVQGKKPPAPSTPSSMIPPYEKPPAKRGKRPGRKAGHPGVRRATPEPTAFQEHRAECCPDCGGALQRCQATRTRTIVDIPETAPVATLHTIHRDWCPCCRKNVEPVVTDALPNAQIGNRALVLSAWLHYGLGQPIDRIVDVFDYHLKLDLSAGGLCDMWHRLRDILLPWYEAIQSAALSAGRLHADETGWRENGRTRWLWCFTTDDATYYQIDKSRGQEALRRFFVEEFGGTLVTDFWGAYNAVACGQRQMCLAHLLRELKHTEQYKRPGEGWPAFAKKLRRLLGDGIRLWRRDEVPDAEYASKRARIDERLTELINTPWEDGNARRLIKRLRRHRNDLFTFLDHDNVPFDNNQAERAIRAAVVMRKNQFGNRSEKGSDTQEVLMSIYQTLRQRGFNPLDVITASLAHYLRTGQLPPLPTKTAPDG